MSKLTVSRGVSGSGKSTWAREQNAVIVSRDDLRDALFPLHKSDPEAYYQADKKVLGAREDYITKVEHEAIRRALMSGQDVISDNTNIQMSYVNKIAKVGYACDAEVEVKVFDVPLAFAVANVKNRVSSGGRPVPESVIRQQYERFKPSASLPPRPEFRVYTGTPGKPDAFMYDLDGTVYHMNGKRGPYAENVDVDDLDPVVPVIISSMTDNQLGSTMFAVAMSGRKERTRDLTEKCLDRDGVWHDDLFMRADDDDRSDDLVKHDLFWTDVAPNYNVRFVIDDRAQVCRMWQRIGIKVLNVAGEDGGEF